MADNDQEPWYDESNRARVYDYSFGETLNYAVDREVAQRLPVYVSTSSNPVWCSPRNDGRLNPRSARIPERAGIMAVVGRKP
jgi:hypothetical protein